MAILYLGNIEFNPLEDDMSKMVADHGKCLILYSKIYIIDPCCYSKYVLP